MTSGGAASGIAHDSTRLAEALGCINAARRFPKSSARLKALYSGFEMLLEAVPGGSPDRGPDGVGSLAELDSILAREGAEAGADALRDFLEPILDRLIEALLDFPEGRLATYGSLLRGEDNHHRVATLVGNWIDGTVEGTLHDRGWAARQGYPGLHHHIPGPPVPVGVLQSAALPGAWDRLDEFEGEGYRRILVPVETENATLVCYLYELADASDAT